MNSQQLQAILLELTQAIQMVIESGEELSDEFQGELANTLQLILERIQEARQREAGTGQPIIPSGLEEGQFPSSNISRFRYDPRNGNLIIQFLGKHPNRNGPIYAYQGVPENIFKIFQRGGVAPTTSGKNAWHSWKQGVTPSLGAAAYHLIRSGGFPFRRIS